MAGYKEIACYDQPDEYTGKNATFGVEPPPAYQPPVGAGTGQPAYPPPAGGAYGQPAYPPPAGGAYGQPAYPPPAGGAYGQPAYTPPAGGAYGQPAYTPPAGGAYGQPAYPPPAGGAYGQPTYAHSSTTVVVDQPRQAVGVIVQPRHQDYLPCSILTCLCCFWPTGLCAIYFANEANSLASAGDLEGARRLSRTARNLAITSVILGIICIAVSIVLRLVVYSENSSETYNY